MAKKALGEENTGAKHKNHRNKSVENAQKRYADISSEMKQLESYCKSKYLGLTPAEKLSLKS